MKIIGLTGGSGTGKGSVAARMRALGAGWVDALVRPTKQVLFQSSGGIELDKVVVVVDYTKGA